MLVSHLLASAKPSFSVVAPSADPPSPGGTLENMCNPKVEMLKCKTKTSDLTFLMLKPWCGCLSSSRNSTMTCNKHSLSTSQLQPFPHAKTIKRKKMATNAIPCCKSASPTKLMLSKMPQNHRAAKTSTGTCTEFATPETRIGNKKGGNAVVHITKICQIEGPRNDVRHSQRSGPPS